MNRKIAVVIIVAAIICTAAGGCYLHIRSLPEYTLKQLLGDFQQDGLKAIESYLVPELRDPYHTLVEIVENPLLRLVAGSEPDTEFLAKLAESIGCEVQLKGVRHGRDSANVSFQLKARSFTGDIDLIMARINGEWLIQSISVPSVGWVF